jgi:hypothetical protein
MLRIIVLSAVAVISVGLSAANAESPSPASARSPGEIAAASRLMAEKQEGCRIEAKRQKLSFFKRRGFIRRCMKSKP